MARATTIGLDIAKQVFQAHGADAAGHMVFRKRLTRTKLMGFFASHRPCLVAMEACAGSHDWGREIGKLGHKVRLIPPAHVKPFVKRQKSDVEDAEANPRSGTAAKHALRSGKERRPTGEQRRVPGSRYAGASAHAVRQRLARSPARIRLYLCSGHYPRSSPD